MRDEVFVRRLEAFGDIVMGFSLGLLGLTLVVPNHAAALFEHQTWLVGYVWTFALVCVMWASHYWTFRYVFVPTPFCLVVNYAKLALTVLLIFMVQVLMRSYETGTARDIVVANELYWGCLAAIWAATALLLIVGLRDRRAFLPPEIERRAVARIYRIAATVPALLVGIFIGARGRADLMSSVVAVSLVVGLALGRAAAALALRSHSGARAS
ncbi:MAG TPA: TMEM175 family protein [Candidatus Cybelea sp.]|jgi:uncharacterized membrane protein|nr:TMEM175 family protein [Candidatus Cybelea sp.]